jgi:anhydro-N-acetylmuramic acid kinase
MVVSSGRPLRVIGLLSGTSMDGVDAALVEVRGTGDRLRARLLDFRTFPFARGDRERLRAAAGRGPKDSAERALLDARLGELFARAALGIARRSGGVGRVDLIGSHGQTILHLPARRGGATVQIGSAARIAAATGVPTVHDFRAADVAAGGEGAPLLPITDYLLFRSKAEDRVILNVGGIANITVLPAGASWERTSAYDTGPGNALIDRLASIFSKGKRSFDAGGAWASRGRTDGDLLDRLLEHPFLRRRPPKSTGTETFGDELARGLAREASRARMSAEDLLATVTDYTAACAGREIRRATGPGASVYVCGGGARNRALLRTLAREVAPRAVRPLEELGIPADAREAVGFALLASEFVHGAGYPMRRVTGARSAAPLGSFTPGPRPFRLRLAARGK